MPMPTLLSPLSGAGLALRNRIVRSGQADVIGIGRGMLNDAGWARKAIEALQ